MVYGSLGLGLGPSTGLRIASKSAYIVNGTLVSFYPSWNSMNEPGNAQLQEVAKDYNESELPWISSFAWGKFAATLMQDAAILDF